MHLKMYRSRLEAYIDTSHIIVALDSFGWSEVGRREVERGR